MTESMNPLGLPYKQHTPQVQGRKDEVKHARRHGVRLHPNSGAGRIKEDASDENRVVEFKNANKSYVLNAADLAGTFSRAARQGKSSVWIINFSNGVEAVIEVNRNGVIE